LAPGVLPQQVVLCDADRCLGPVRHALRTAVSPRGHRENVDSGRFRAGRVLGGPASLVCGWGEARHRAFTRTWRCAPGVRRSRTVLMCGFAGLLVTTDTAGASLRSLAK